MRFLLHSSFLRTKLGHWAFKGCTYFGHRGVNVDPGKINPIRGVFPPKVIRIPTKRGDPPMKINQGFYLDPGLALLTCAAVRATSRAQSQRPKTALPKTAAQARLELLLSCSVAPIIFALFLGCPLLKMGFPKKGSVFSRVAEPHFEQSRGVLRCFLVHLPMRKF